MKMNLKTTAANGVLPLSLGWRGGMIGFDIVGGPYDRFRKGLNGDFGVCVRAERVPADVDVWVPIPDFGVPDNHVTVMKALETTLRMAMRGKRIWVGCAGGYGRTGLFLALLAKCCRVDDPVGYVRAKYNERAIETVQQSDYVRKFDVSPLRRKLWFWGWRERLAQLILSW